MRSETLFALTLLAGSAPSFAQQDAGAIAIMGGTVIDGNGGPPLENAVVLIRDGRIVAVGPVPSTPVPPGTRTIEAGGKFVTPGFIDTNVHLSLYGGNSGERYETLVRYYDRQEDVVLESAQMQLKYGVTTVRDSYGVLPPLKAVRDRIARGDAIGARILAAGNIVGWGGPFSITFSLIPEAGLTPFQERMNDLIAQGAGEDLMDMTPSELKIAINAYLDRGVDFVKYGGTGHTSMPTLIGFSPEAQKVLVEETHSRELVAETHSTTLEGLRLSIEAGVDLVQHPEILSPREITEDLVALFRERYVICSMLVNTMTGPAWKEHLEKREAARKKLSESGAAPLTGHQGTPAARDLTAAEKRRQAEESGEPLETRRRNAVKLIEGGCRVTVGTDNYRAAAPEFARKPKPGYQDAGEGTIVAIEGLVELGMTPAQAIVSATRNGAIACRGLRDFGTIEPGKRADLLVLDANPLENISNIRKLNVVVSGGRIVETDRLPEKPIYFRR
ncbi:MAG TPA: amidohydrolase family protein [Vicinamibacteria bacterium]|nr:amidohydrolase family protein [Vicinamibacteria bacterium]